MYKRKVYDTIIKRLEERRMFIQVIMGPRQIGKSTVIRQVLDDLDKPSLFYSADTIPSTSSTWISECWANARLQMRAQGQEEMILVIDEIQKLKNWSEYVKKEWDTDSLNRIKRLECKQNFFKVFIINIVFRKVHSLSPFVIWYHIPLSD